MSAEPFYEDMRRKSRWWLETRGELSLEQLNKRWRAALAQTQVLREARTAVLDPDGKPPAGAVALAGGRKRAAATEAELPPGLEHVASAAAQVTGVDVRDGAVLKLRVARGAARRLDLRTAALFRFDERTREWRIVERSGPGEGGQHVWGLAHRDGLYVALALPRDARPLALERIAYHYAGLGVQTGELARAADLFDKTRFTRLVAYEERIETGSSPDRKRLAELTSLHRELRPLKAAWRGQLPNGGLPEWQLLEHVADLRPGLVAELNLADLIDVLPGVLRPANRVGRWKRFGPRNINGRVKSIAIDPTNGNVLYAGAANGGVWKTTNAGDSWRPLWKFSDTMAVGSIAVAPSRAQTIWVATGEDTTTWGPSYGGTGVHRSTDGGTTWQQRGTAAQVGIACSKLVVHPTRSNTVFVASVTGVHRTTDGGATWTRLRAGHATDLVIAHDRPDILYAGFRNDGVYKTTDGGATWSRLQGGSAWTSPYLGEVSFEMPTGGDAHWPKVAIARSGPAGSERIAVKLGAEGKTTAVSSDGGASFFPLGVQEGADYDEWTSFISINPGDHRRIHVGSVWMQASNTSGTFSPTSGTHADHHQIVYDPGNPAICWVACDGGVYRSTDWGRTWTLRSDLLQAAQLLSAGVAQAGTFVVGCATQDQGIVQSEGDLRWDDHGGGNEWGMFVVDPNDSDNIFISPDRGDLRRSTNRGRTYTDISSGLTDWWAARSRTTPAAVMAGVAVQPGNSRIVIGAGWVEDEVKNASGAVVATYGPFSRIFTSVNGGSSWRAVFDLPAKPRAIAYSHDGTRAFVAVSGGRIFRSDECGLGGWYEPATGSNAPPAGKITSIAVDPDEKDVLYITYGDRDPHVLRSTDGGAHWTSVSGATPATRLPNIAVSSLVVDPEHDDVLYVGTDVGVFRTNDGGATWYPYNDAADEDDLPFVVVTALVHRRADQRLFAATLGRGMYVTHTSGIARLRAVAIRKWLAGRPTPGIERLRVTDGWTTWEMTRAEVIRRIEAGTTVYTRDAAGNRAEVLVMAPDAEHPRYYLRTTPDATTANNLLSLPHF